MEQKNTKQIVGLKELYRLLEKALEKSQHLGTTSKSATLTRMLGVIEFEHFKLTGASIFDEEDNEKAPQVPPGITKAAADAAKQTPK